LSAAAAVIAAPQQHTTAVVNLATINVLVLAADRFARAAGTRRIGRGIARIVRTADDQ
jgi:hypothetical protein